MSFKSLSHLSAKQLLEKLRDALARERCATVEILQVLIEVDRRRLWAKTGYASLYAFCVGELGYSEDAAFKRMRAARLARRYPAILDMVADGRLHLSALVLLHPYVTPHNAKALLAASEHRTKRQIRAMLAERFPQPAVATRVTPLETPAEFPQLAPGPVGIGNSGDAAAAEPTETSPVPITATEAQLAPGPVEAQPGESAPAPGWVAPASDYSRVAPLAPQRFSVQFTMDEAMHADLIRAQELLGANAGDDRVRDVFRRALSELVKTLEKRKLAAADTPRKPSQKPANGRHIPAPVKREVRTRDQDRCTFVTGNGKRCESRTGLEFDHVLPIAKGGKSTTDNLRLLCHAHNQLEADRAFGEGFMHGIRKRSRHAGVAASLP